MTLSEGSHHFFYRGWEACHDSKDQHVTNHCKKFPSEQINVMIKADLKKRARVGPPTLGRSQGISSEKRMFTNADRFLKGKFSPVCLKPFLYDFKVSDNQWKAITFRRACFVNNRGGSTPLLSLTPFPLLTALTPTSKSGVLIFSAPTQRGMNIYLWTMCRY